MVILEKNFKLNQLTINNQKTFMSKDLKKKRQQELLSYKKTWHLKVLNQQETVSSDESSSKLRAYSVILIDHLNWEIQDQYLELLDKFMEKKMNTFDFRNAFCERYTSIEQVADVLKSNKVLLSPNQKSLEFGDLLAKIDNCCQAYSDDPEPFRNKFEIGEVEFRTSIEKTYFQIQKYLNEE